METSIDRDTLVKVLGRLGSDQDPEVVTAARIALGTLREAGLSWDDVLVRSLPGDGDPRGALLAVDRQLHRLAKHDQAEFMRLRERFFATGTLDAADQRRLAYFTEFASPPPSDDVVPF